MLPHLLHVYGDQWDRSERPLFRGPLAPETRAAHSLSCSVSIEYVVELIVSFAAALQAFGETVCRPLGEGFQWSQAAVSE